MTERWRKKLEGIDGASPSDDVFERAKEGPMRRDDALPGPRMSTRVVTIVAAFLVFALAISVFAIPALRMGNEAAGQGSVLLPLWPAQTSDQLEQLQANPASWALDPAQVAEQFGQQVMGWPHAWVGEAACDLPAYVSSSPSYSSPSVPNDHTFSESCVPLINWARGPSSAPPAYPYASDSAEPAQDGAFRSYSIFPNDPQSAWSLGPPEYVQVYQPLEQGDGQIWAVRQAQGQETLSVAPGQVVHDGSSVSASFVTDRELVPTLGYGSCGNNAASSESSLPGGLGGAGIQIDVHLTGGCEGEQPGYVWAVASNVSLAHADTPLSGVVDPFADDHPALSSLTAAPVTMVFPPADAETTTPTSPTPETSASPTVEPSQWTTFDGGLGFTMELPADWGTTSVTDEIVVNAPGGDPYIQINRVEDPARDDSSFPLNFADYEGNNQPHFYGDGQTFIIQWLTGTPDPLTPEQSAVVERIVESIRFEHWQIGDQRNGWAAVGEILPASSAEWMYAVTGDGENYIATNVNGVRTLFGPFFAPADCLEPTYEVRSSGVAGVTCKDGTGGDWDFEGRPQPGNDPEYDMRLPGYPAVRSWDGQLLVRLP